MLGEQFASDMAAPCFQIRPSWTSGAATLVLHGDTLCTDDVDYQQFRELVHSPDWQADMMTKSLDERRELAQLNQ